MNNKLTYPALLVSIALSICLIIQDCFATQWARTYGGNQAEYVRYCPVQQTRDGGYIAVGYTGSFGGGYDMWILKLDQFGKVTWQKKYGGFLSEYAHSIQQTTDGGYIMAGEASSFGDGSQDFWILKLDAAGNVSWQKNYGGGGLIMTMPTPSSRPEMGVILW